MCLCQSFLHTHTHTRTRTHTLSLMPLSLLLVALAFHTCCSLTCPLPTKDREGWFPANHVRPATIDVTSASERSSFKRVAAQAQAILRHSTLDRLSPADRKMIWMFRRDLQGDALALPRVVQAMPVCHTPSLVEELEALILSWAPPSPLQALELLQQSFADRNIRAAAVHWIAQMDACTFAAVLPQLVQAIKFELFHCNELSTLLVERALGSPRVAVQLFWLLRCEADNRQSGARYQLLLDLLLSHAPEHLRRELAWQVTLVARLKALNRRIVGVGGGEARKKALSSALQRLSGELPVRFHLPLDAAMQVSGIKAQRCSFFTSNAVPLRLVFNNADTTGVCVCVLCAYLVFLVCVLCVCKSVSLCAFTSVHSLASFDC